MAAKRVKRETIDLTTHDRPSTPADHGAEYERLQKEVVYKNEVISALEEFLGKIQKGCCCGICTELLYQPFNLSCGHVFCYSCLVDWFKQTKQCPTCRKRVVEKPAVSYLIKDIVNSLVRRVELVDPEGQGARFNKEQAEADKYVRDHGGDLFPGLFHHTQLPHGNRIVDEADGVLRCIRCNWEVEGPACTHCGLTFSDDEQEAFSAFDEDVEDLDEEDSDSESDSDDDEEDDDDDDEDEDEYEDSFVVPDDEVHLGDDWDVRARGLYPFYHDIDFSDGDEDMDDDEDEDEEESSEEDDDDDDDDDDEFEEAHETLPHHPPNVINIDEDDENNHDFLYYTNYYNPPETSDHDEEGSSPEDESDDDELPPRRPGHAPPPNRHPVVVNQPHRRTTRSTPAILRNPRDRSWEPSANGRTNVARQSRRPRPNVIDSD